MKKCRYCFKDYDEVAGSGVCPECGYFEGREQDDPRYLPIGSLLNDRYVVGGVIGVGGFGITYKVWDLKYEVCKAVKEYFQHGVVNRIPGTKEVIVHALKRKEEFEYGKARLLEEAQIVAKFQSKYIVKVDDFFAENNTSYMVMEYLESKTVEKYIRERNMLMDPEEATDMALKVCEALDEMHKAGVIHRDISPDNIHIDEAGNVKVIDFGSARLSKEDVEEKMIMIKPGYAPPEQYEKIDLRNDKQFAWTDVYALGATLYVTLTGKVPAESTDRKMDLDNNMDRVCYPKDINPLIPDNLNHAIMKAMAVNIHERFQTVTEFAEVLRGDKKIEKIEVIRRRKKQRRSWGIGGGFVVAALLFGLFFKGYSNQVKEVNLKEAEIDVWYSVNAENRETRVSAMESIVEEVLSSNVFTDVQIHLQAIEESEYEQKLQDAKQSGQMPHMFEDRNTIDLNEANEEAIKKLLKEIDIENCNFLKQYGDTLVAERHLPMGFHIPVIYLNTSFVKDYKEGMKVTSMKDLLTLAEGNLEQMPMVMKEELKEAYGNMFADYKDYEAKLSVTGEKDDFLNEKSAIFFADTSDYFDVHASLPAKYVMIPLEVDSVICSFTDYWTIGEGTEEEMAAVYQFAKVLYSDNGQDKFYLQNKNEGLPLMKTLIDDYIDIYKRFEVLLTDLNTYTFLLK